MASSISPLALNPPRLQADHPFGAVEPCWPPKSPHDALLSSPSGRNKIRQLYDRTSPSPSPLKRSGAILNSSNKRRKLLDEATIGQDEDEDDEETLQLQLQALEAKLKLKKLQQKKGKTEGTCSNARSSRKENIPPASGCREQSERLPEVAVPFSPSRKSIKSKGTRREEISVVDSPRRSSSGLDVISPSKVLLGIDKGRKGTDVSLRRPKKGATSQDPFLDLAHSNNITSRRSTPGPSKTPDDIKRMSFSEKVAQSRQQEKARSEQEAKRSSQRSSGFGLAQKELDALKHKAESEHLKAKPQPNDPSLHVNNGGFSREQILEAKKKADPGVVSKSKASANQPTAQSEGSSDVWLNPNAQPEPTKKPPQPKERIKPRERSSSPHPRKAIPETTSDQLFDAFSMTHLSKRLLPRDFLTRTFAEKSVLRVPDLLATVKSPDYSLPDDLEADYVVLATIASKSSPIAHQNATKETNEETTSRDEAAAATQNNKGKFMVLKLTDLKWTLDLYLFTTAYTRFYKLSPGTVIAILNPGIMPPKPHMRDTGRFSLTLNSSDDTVLEIGTSRDLGWCKASRKDGKQCSDWIDKRHTEFCEFHTDIVTERTRRGRMEVQGMSAPFAPGGRKQGRTGHFGGGGKGSGPKSKSGDFLTATEQRQDGFRKEGMQYNRSTSSKYYIVPSSMAGGGGGSAADLLDAEDFMTNRGESKAERLRKRLAERERENELAKRLGDRGNGAGSEYMRLTQQSHNDGGAASQQTSEGQRRGDEVEAIDAGSLGLLGNKAGGVHLSPIKKSLKRTAGSGVVEGESAMKKTRFVTEKGIREAGRESLPGPGNRGGPLGGDDDDDLEIE